VPGKGGLRFVFYGRVSTEDYQGPVTSRARQLGQAVALVAGHGRIVAEFFDIGQSRTLAWARRPQAAALVAELADPDRGPLTWCSELQLPDRIPLASPRLHGGITAEGILDT
jgi:hypothetical protein